jgi:hypothetical protein
MPDYRALLGLPALVRSWPRRRWVAALVLVTPLAALYASVGPSLQVWWVLSAPAPSPR